MKSFAGFTNNAVIKLQIYFNSHMLIVRQNKASFLLDFIYLYRTVVHTNIKMFALFLYILILFPKKILQIVAFGDVISKKKAAARDKILIVCQPMIKLQIHYGFHELFLHYKIGDVIVFSLD